jgi:hypothetical protein
MRFICYLMQSLQSTEKDIEIVSIEGGEEFIESTDYISMDSLTVQGS